MGRVRVALGLLSGAVAVALCVVLVDTYVLRAEWWQVRHTVTGEPAAPQSEVGPPPGPLAVSWELATRTHRGSVAGYDGVAFQVARGQVVTASGHGIEARDARTGGARWSYRRAGWSLLGWTSTGSRVVAYFERDGDRGDRMLVAFDALSGGLLWRRQDERPAAVSRTTLRWPAGSGVLLTADEGRRTLFGVSAVTGNRVWRLALPRGCRLFEGGAHPSDGREDLAALGLRCAGPGSDKGHRSRLLAVDPTKGIVRWERRLGSRESPEVSMLDGVTLVSDGTALRAFDDGGRQFGIWKGDGVCGDLMCPGVLAPGRLVVVYHPDGAAGRAPRGRAPTGRQPTARAWARPAWRRWTCRPGGSGGAVTCPPTPRSRRPGAGVRAASPAVGAVAARGSRHRPAGRRQRHDRARAVLDGPGPAGRPALAGGRRRAPVRGAPAGGAAPGRRGPAGRPARRARRRRAARARRRAGEGLAGRVLPAEEGRSDGGAPDRLRHRAAPRVGRDGAPSAPGVLHVRAARRRARSGRGAPAGRPRPSRARRARPRPTPRRGRGRAARTATTAGRPRSPASR
ncbi:PQQ-binding-like beta-propeller repeat protein [Actinomadura luteofluorescens]|uniref:outer membrane protein assembly factor BamB family protein n=1 Tax=Actinomadura luteofluorescens TaxID=46163 RepID=UPI00363A7E72